jgi:hypothetical protein
MKMRKAAASTAKGRLMAILGIANGFTANSVWYFGEEFVNNGC